MRIVRQELHEVCQHRNLTLDYVSGVNGITGPNGRGKSNILKMLKACLTGDFSSNAGNKDENICVLAPSTAPAYIVTDWYHGETHLEQVRGLRGCRTQLKIDGGEPIIGDTKVNAAVMEVLGVDPAIITNYVFVDQGKLFDFIDITPAVRSAQFQTLFGTGKAKELYKSIGTWLDALEEPAPVDRDALRERVASITQQREELVAALKPLQSYATYDPKLDANAKVVSLYEAYQRVQKDIATCDTEIRRLEPLVDQAAKDRDDLTARLVDMRATLKDSKASADDARVQIANWRRYSTNKRRRDDLQRSITLKTQDLEALTEPLPPPGYIPDEDRQQHLLDAEKELDRYRWVPGFAKGFKRPARPTGIAAAIYKMVDEAEDKEVELGALINEVRLNIKASKAYDDALAAHHRSVQQLTSEIASEKKSLEAFELDAPTGTQEDFDELLSAFEELEQEITKADRELQRLNTNCTRLETQLTTQQDRRTTLIKEQPAEISQTRYDRAQKALATTQADLALYQRYSGRLESVEEQLETAHDDLAQAEESALVRQRILDLRARVESVRSVFHHEQLPRSVANHYLELLSDDINELLTLFEIDFRVEADSNLTFTARFLDGRRQPAARLSGGQKVVLAMAFRIAVNSMFAKGIGLLCLDEPTQFLDKQNLLCLETALGKLKELSASRGLQCLLITHEDALATMFDASIRLG